MLRSGPPAVICCLVLMFTVVGIASTAQAQDVSSCDTSYAQAQEAYYAAEFEAAAAQLRPCTQNPTLPDSVRARMYRLLSFVYLGQNDEAAARRAVESLLDLHPDYVPDPAQDRPDFVAIVEKAKKERQARAEADEEGNRRWVRWTIGVAAAALGTAAVLLFGGGGSDDGPEPLPRPEPPPE